RIGVIQPRRKDIQAAKDAKVFVRSQLVGIVSATPIILEAAYVLTPDVETGHGAVCSVGIHLNGFQQLVDMLAAQNAFFPKMIGKLDILANDQLVPPKPDRIIL